MKKITAFLLVFCFIFTPISSIVADAKPMFSDVKKHWSKEYIESISDLKIVKGYEDGTFKPDKKVTKCESAVMLYQMLDSQGLIDKSNAKQLENKYKEVMDNASIPPWPRYAIAYFIENKIIPLDDIKLNKDLKGFMFVDPKTDNVYQVEIARERVFFYLGKALNVYLKENVNGVIDMKFDDFSEIYEEYQPYIDLLAKKKIVQGSDNKVKPKASITRGEFAKIVSDSLKILKDKNIQKENTNNTNIKKAIVKSKFDSLKKVVFTEINNPSNSFIEIIDGNVEVYIGSKVAKYEDLTNDMTVKLTFKDNKLIKVQVDEIEYETIDIHGVVSNVNDEKRVLFYIDSVSNKTKYITIPADVTIKVNGKIEPLSKVKNDQQVTLKYKQEKLIAIEFYSKTQTVEGTLQSVEIGDTLKVIVKINGKNEVLDFAKKYTLIRNNISTSINDFKPEDKLFITKEYGKVVKIEARAINTLMTGTLKTLSKNLDSNTIVVEFENGEEQEFLIRNNVKVRLDGKTVDSVFDLEIGFTVKLRNDGKDLVQIDGYSKEQKIGFVGYVTNINSSTKIIDVETDQANYALNLENAKIINLSGTLQSFSYIKLNQKIFFYGIKNANYLNVDNLIILD